ncbi:MAG: ribonuclease III [Candidatus Colwellbacteria bacterium]|nr:ribonuclease III [Candidatus Colwellbacteria bacterium]
MNYEEIEEKIGVVFGNRNLLKEALTHRSYMNEAKEPGAAHNERLEFLGDAVLELIVTTHLFNLFPQKMEGELTLYRAALVNSRTLYQVAEELMIIDKVQLSKSEARESLKSKSREKIAANALEALIGAIYLDKGYDVARVFVEKNIMSKLDKVELGGKDAKSIVQERAQSEFKITPTYKVLEESGPAHAREFRVGLFFGDKKEAEGDGKSKQEAELNAAAAWLSK